MMKFALDFVFAGNFKETLEQVCNTSVYNASRLHTDSYQISYIVNKFNYMRISADDVVDICKLLLDEEPYSESGAYEQALQSACELFTSLSKHLLVIY